MIIKKYISRLWLCNWNPWHLGVTSSCHPHPCQVFKALCLDVKFNYIKDNFATINIKMYVLIIANKITWKSYSLVLIPTGSTARYLISRHPKPKAISGNIILAFSPTLWMVFIVAAVLIDTIFMIAYILYSAYSKGNLAPSFNIYSYIWFQSWVGNIRNSNLKSCFTTWNGGNRNIL